MIRIKIQIIMERIDKEGIINAALRVAGFTINQDSTEKVLQIAELVISNPNATLKDVMKICNQADELNGIQVNK